MCSSFSMPLRWRSAKTPLLKHSVRQRRLRTNHLVFLYLHILCLFGRVFESSQGQRNSRRDVFEVFIIEETKEKKDRAKSQRCQERWHVGWSLSLPQPSISGRDSAAERVFMVWKQTGVAEKSLQGSIFWVLLSVLACCLHKNLIQARKRAQRLITR